jgi:hypothetical protein
MESLSRLIVENILEEQERLVHQVVDVLDDEGWELDIEFTPEGFAEVPDLLVEFLENEEVSPEARLQLEILGRLVRKGAYAAGRAAGSWQRAKKRAQQRKQRVQRFGRRVKTGAKRRVKRVRTGVQRRVKRARTAVRKSFRAGVRARR